MKTIKIRFVQIQDAVLPIQCDLDAVKGWARHYLKDGETESFILINEAELREKCRKCEEKPGTPVYCECGLPCYSITIKEILKGDSDGSHSE